MSVYALNVGNNLPMLYNNALTSLPSTARRSRCSRALSEYSDVPLVSYVDANAPKKRTSLSAAGVYAFVLIVSLFFLWGVANNLNDILIKQFKKAFELSDFRAGLVQSAFYVGYFLLAIPASLVTRHYG